MSKNYDDIINLPHHVSGTHPRMSSINRAAQFAPFAALSGYDTTIQETARLTDERVELDEYTIAALDLKLRMLAEIIAERPEITVTYYRPDIKKKGGAYVNVTGAVKKIDDYEKTVVFSNGERIAITDILEIECELFKSY